VAGMSTLVLAASPCAREAGVSVRDDLGAITARQGIRCP
jgi:hypothetical protein